MRSPNIDLQIILLILTAGILQAAEPLGISATLLSVIELRREDVSKIAKPIDPLFDNNAESSLVLAFRLQGKPIARAALVGKASIQKASDDRGTVMSPSPDALKFGNSIFSSLIDRKSLDFFRGDQDKSPDAIYVTMQVTPPARAATRFSLHSTVRVVTGDREVIIIPEIVTAGISDSAAATLSKYGLALTTKLNAKGTALNIEGAIASMLEYDLIDDKGESLSIGTSSQLDAQDNRKNIEFSAFAPIMKTARLKLAILRNREELSVPIEVDNIALP